MKRVLFVLVLALLAKTGWAQITYTKPAFTVSGSGYLPPGPVYGAAGCTTVPFAFVGSTTTGICASATDTFNVYTGGSSRLQASSTAVTSTVPIYVPDGTASAPSISFSTSGMEDTGFYRNADNQIAIATAGSRLVKFAGGIEVTRDTGYFTLGSAADVMLYRDTAAALQLGVDVNGAAVAQTIKSHDGITGSNIAGADLTVASGRGTGTGTPGKLVFSTASTGTTGTTAQTNTERLRIGEQAVSGTLPFAFQLTADAAIYPGQTVMPDAGTDGRFDVTTGNATLSIGVLAANGASAQGTAYAVVFGGVAYVAPAEDQAVTRGHYLLQSATAGYVSDSATVSTDGLNIALALYSEPVSNIIDPTGCGGGGCINTTSGVITLSADVAAAGWTVGQPVIYWNSGGTTPTGLTDGKVYFLTSVSTTTVTIAATKGGATIVPSSQGDDATQYLQRLPQAVVSIR